MSPLPAIDLPVVTWVAALALCGALAFALVASFPSFSASSEALAFAAFGDRVETTSRRVARRDRLRAGRIDTTYRRYAATTLLYATVGAFFGGVLAAALVVVALSSPAIRGILTNLHPMLEAALSPPSLSLVVSVSVVTGLFGAALVGGSIYWFRWWLPAARARTRKRRIDLTFSRTVALLYALSRGSVAVPEIMATLHRHRGAYGAAAGELSVAVRDMDLLGADVLTAIERVGDRTPSDRFAVFCENFATVLRSGGNTADFLREQYERHQRRVETRQSMFLEWLATFAEVYVSLLVVGPLFLITILLVMGLTSGGVIGTLSLLVYLIVPLANLGFALALDRFTGPLRLGADANATATNRSSSDSGARSTANVTSVADTTTSPDDPGFDGEGLTPEEAATIERLTTEERTRGLRRGLADPLGAVLDRPTRLLYVTVPFACCWLASRIWLAREAGTLAVGTIDDTVVMIGILLTGTFALVHEVRRRRIERVERTIPELLDRLASLNEVGISVVRALDRLSDSELGELDAEIERINRDIAIGATVSDALSRFDDRVRTASVTRVVALVTNAMRASGEIAPVLRVAAEEARTRRTRKRKRRQEMATYLVIIYLSFLVFLAIVFVLITVFMPTIPSPATLGESGLAGRTVGLTEARKDTYVQVLFHAAAIQGVASGFVAGQMAKGDLADGAKHAAVMLVLAYGAFLLFA